MNRNHKICQEGGFEPEGFSGYVSGIFSGIFPICVFAWNKKAGGWFRASRFFSSILQICFKFCSVFLNVLCWSKNKYRTNTGKDTGKISEKPFRLETTLLAKFVVPIHDLLLLHFSSQKTNTEKYKKYRKLIGQIPEKKSLRLDTTLPAQIYCFAWAPSQKAHF